MYNKCYEYGFIGQDVFVGITKSTASDIFRKRQAISETRG